MSSATANGKPEGEIAPTQTRLGELGAQLMAELEQAKAQRDELVEQLRDADRLVERIAGAVKALTHGPTQKRERGKAKGPSSHAGEETVQLVEATIARMETPVTVADVATALPHRHETIVRDAIYALRDSGRVRLVDKKGNRASARYDLMPEVRDEHGAA